MRLNEIFQYEMKRKLLVSQSEILVGLPEGYSLSEQQMIWSEIENTIMNLKKCWKENEENLKTPLM